MQHSTIRGQKQQPPQQQMNQIATLSSEKNLAKEDNFIAVVNGDEFHHEEGDNVDEDPSITKISTLIRSVHNQYPHQISFLDFQQAFTEVSIDIADVAVEEEQLTATTLVFPEFPFLSLRGENKVNPLQVQEMETRPKVKMKKKPHLKSRARAAEGNHVIDPG
ncbi:hypothetical protein L7F22_040858 [Adiantum nelumboides]|nr:hypothetical protein [Adiantum nelumboides]